MMNQESKSKSKLIAKIELFDIWKNAEPDNLVPDDRDLLERFEKAGIQYELIKNSIMAEVYVAVEQVKQAYSIIRQRAREEA